MTTLRKLVLSTAVLAILLPAGVRAQTSDNAFIFTIYGGLFFPANLHFEEQYNSKSDLIWGVGICLPVADELFLTFDQGFFKSEAVVDPNLDVGRKIEERFSHLGILFKQTVVQRLSIRLSGGPNYVTVKQTITTPSAPDQTIEAEKKIGFFVGPGIEELFPDGRASLFADVLYDYRRSHVKSIEGDYGGLRVVVGFHLFLF